MNAPDLHVHSTFSSIKAPNDAIGTPKEIVERAAELGWEAAAITEHGVVASAIPFYQACRAKGINPIIGCEFYIVTDDILGVQHKDVRSSSYHLTVLALSAEGYHNLVKWTSISNLREYHYGKPRISIEEMIDHAPYPLHHNVVLSGCLGSELCLTLANNNGNGIAVAADLVAAMKCVFPNYYIEVQDHRREKFIGRGFKQYEEMIEREAMVRGRLLKLAKQTDTPVVITNDSHFQRPDQRKTHLAMKSNPRGRGDEGFGNSTEVNMARYLPDYVYFSSYMQGMERIADGIPGGQRALGCALEIAKEASIRLKPLDDFSYSIPFSGYADPIATIRGRCKARLAALVSRHGKVARERFEHELASMGDFAHYLLLISDFIVGAKKQGILTNTRGSAANSILCYCLKIHDIDSMEYGLLFSRFYNPARKKLPDIDVDIERERFDDFMQPVFERLKELEGEGQVLPIGNYGTNANRSSFRLIAEALGVSKEKQDEISKLLPQMIDSGMVDEENDVYEALKDEFPEIYQLASGVFDSIKNMSQHACGWVFGTRERPLSKWVPSVLIASSNTTVAQFNLKFIGDLGLVKGDFLRLKTLSVIQQTRRALGHNSLDITDIPLDDAETYKMLREGRTEGIFTLQGKENRRGCIEVEVENVHDVIRTVAIYRPALTREGKDDLYNRRRKGLEEVKYPNKLAEGVLSSTYGVPVFQEQAMELGYAVGMSDAEVDEIYEAIKMAKGVGRGAKEAFNAIRPKFFKRARKLMSEQEAKDVWELLQSFQGYGFNKGHATSYGILAVRAAYLKCHHPAEFFSALLNVYPEKDRYLAAARSEGFSILPPCVNASSFGFSLDRNSGHIRTGLSKVKGLGPVAVREIIAGQPYSSLDDFKSRTTRRAVNKTRIESLALIGAMESIGIRKEGSDVDEFQILGFTLGKPQAFRGCKPRLVASRTSERGWHFAGLDRSVELTEARQSVAKRFWIPPIEKLIEVKASPWAMVESCLLTVVDENGVPFQIQAQQNEEAKVMTLNYLAKKFQDHVVCIEGKVKKPFLTDGPLTFSYFNIIGATEWQDDPQVWKAGGEKVNDKKRMALVGLAGMARRQRKVA